jgi:hypothetical protein
MPRICWHTIFICGKYPRGALAGRTRATGSLAAPHFAPRRDEDAAAEVDALIANGESAAKTRRSSGRNPYGLFLRPDEALRGILGQRSWISAARVPGPLFR